MQANTPSGRTVVTELRQAFYHALLDHLPSSPPEDFQHICQAWQRASEAFDTVGKVKLVAGRAMSPSTVGNAQVLLVRSVTKVNRELLENSHVEFVGTATAGLDHIDMEYLQSQRIGFASAQGGNANSVAEYVVTALLSVAKQQGMELGGKTIGIVGVGNIGQAVKLKAESLGMTVILNDPPLEQKTGYFWHRHPAFLPAE